MKMNATDLSKRFDAHAEDYDTQEAFWRRAAGRVVVTAADPSPKDVILDLGCGTASLTVDLAERAEKVIGLDLSPAMLDQAKARIDARSVTNIELHEHDFRTLPPLEPVSIVTSNYAIHHLSMDEKRKLFLKFWAWSHSRHLRHIEQATVKVG